MLIIKVVFYLQKLYKQQAFYSAVLKTWLKDLWIVQAYLSLPEVSMEVFSASFLLFSTLHYYLTFSVLECYQH